MVQQGTFDYEGEEWETISEKAKDLINKLITRPERRLTAQEALQHPWMRTHGVKATSERDTHLRGLKLSNMKKFCKTQKLKQVALMAIAV